MGDSTRANGFEGPLLALLLLGILPFHAEDFLGAPSLEPLVEDITIRVLNEKGRGVASDIVSITISEKGTEKRTPIGETKGDEPLNLDRGCNEGERFLAKPKDTTYYPSWQYCASRLVLEVSRKPPSVPTAKSTFIRSEGLQGIHATVTSTHGDVLPGAIVTVESIDTGNSRTGITASNGVVTLVQLSPSTSYDVIAQLEGFANSRVENVEVRAGNLTKVKLRLEVGARGETIIVTSEAPLVQTTSETGQEMTLELIEYLPTARDYLQLAPGALTPVSERLREHPALRSGLNYQDRAGRLGASRDNAYYIDGLSVTDPVDGTLGANLQTEIVAAQNVLTGGIPAQYGGVPGGVLNVNTKSGSNHFFGSVNYYDQDESLVDEDDNAPGASFSAVDKGFTLGGFVKKDKTWFFLGYNSTKRDEDVISLDMDEFLRRVKEQSDSVFFKLSWAISDSAFLNSSLMLDPTDREGSLDRDVLNNRSVRQDSGGSRYLMDFSKVFASSVLFQVAAGKHEGEASQFSATEEPRNDVLFRAEDVSGIDLSDEQLGGAGVNRVDERDNEFIRASVSWWGDTKWGTHDINGGLQFQKHLNFRSDVTPGGATYESLDRRYLGQRVTAGELSTDSWTSLAFDVFNPGDFAGLVRAIDRSLRRESLYAILDSDGDGVLSMDEVAQALRFESIVGNPSGQINYHRTIQSAQGAQETSSESLAFYVQDSLSLGRFTFDVGLRAERYEHFATTGDRLFTFDWEFSPRLSVVHDIRGDGRQALRVYYGRYYDSVRNDVTNFAGSLTGAVQEEQVFVDKAWLTYRVRGGTQPRNAVFAPTTETPYTDDFLLGYEFQLARNMSLRANLTRRESRNILEDYDLSLYALTDDGQTLYPGPVDHPDSLFLGLGYFGLANDPGANFVLATLAGGKRDWEGIELVFRRRYSNHWQALASYTYADARGNTNSDSDTNLQGNLLFLDPRAPNLLATQPGLVRNLVNVAGSYHWENGFSLGGVFRWNSGTLTSRTFAIRGRHLPIRIEQGQEFDFAGVKNRWVDPEAVGSFKNPEWSSFDLDLQYNDDFSIGNTRVMVKVFLDVFNVFDDQGESRLQDLVSGTGAAGFGEPIQWVPPRRYFLGVRIGF